LKIKDRRTPPKQYEKHFMTKFVSLAVNQDINLRLHFTDYSAHLLMKRTLAAGQSSMKI
jgi:hypothetical protein